MFLKAHDDDSLVQARGNIHQLRHLVVHGAVLTETGGKMSGLRRTPWLRVSQGATWSVPIASSG